MQQFLLGCLLCFGITTSALAQNTIEDDIYVRLYAIRKERAETEVKIAEKEVWYTGNARSRAEQLYVRNAMSLSDYEISQRDFDMSVATQRSREAAVREANALLMIATDRVTIGLIPPICLELR